MKKITNKQYEEYRRLIYDREHGRILTPDGLRLMKNPAAIIAIPQKIRKIPAKECAGRRGDSSPESRSNMFFRRRAFAFLCGSALTMACLRFQLRIASESSSLSGR